MQLVPKQTREVRLKSPCSLLSHTEPNVVPETARTPLDPGPNGLAHGLAHGLAGGHGTPWSRDLEIMATSWL